jgi:hypothetical protein
VGAQPLCTLLLLVCAAGAVYGAPASPTATLLGNELYTEDADELQSLIITALFEDYAREQGIAADPAEIDAWVDGLRRARAADDQPGLESEDDLTPEEAAEVARMRNDMARAIIVHWKLNRALYRQYGGRIIFQQLGPEPLDAYRAFLEQKQREGAFTINDPALATQFWRYFTEDTRHDFFEPGSEEEARAFSVPPWEQFGLQR